MPWFLWVIVADLAISALAKVWQVDRPRKRITRSEAVGSLIVTACYIYIIVAVTA